MTHLDTSFVVDLLREARRRKPGPAMAMRERLENEELWLSVFVVCELMAGAELSRRPSEERQHVVAFCNALQTAYPDEAFGRTYGRLLASLHKAGQTIGAMDLLIATAAVVDDATLVTRNQREFSRVPGLKIASYGGDQSPGAGDRRPAGAGTVPAWKGVRPPL